MTNKILANIVFSRAISACLVSFTCLGAIAQAQQSPTSPQSQARPTVGSGLGSNSSNSNEKAASRPTVTRRTPTATPPKASSSKQRPISLDGLLGGGSVMIGGSTQSQALRVVASGEPFEPLLEKNIAYGTLPKAVSDEAISLIGPMDALEFLDALSAATGWNIAASPGLAEVQLSFWLNEMTPTQAIGVLKFNEIFYDHDVESDLLFVMTKKEFLEREHGSTVRRVFELSHTSLENVEGGIAALLSAKGRMVADPRTSTLIVFDTEENLEHMDRLVAQFDQERVSRTYELKYANGGMLFTSIEVLLSESGKLSYDPRSNTLIVLDREQQQKQISQTLRTLDMPIDTRSWILDYADVGLVAEHLLPVVPESMGTITYDEEMRQITVTAMLPRLHEVDNRIREWDKERQQVQIEAYLVSVGSEIARNIGLNWSVAGNLGEGFSTTSFGSTELSSATASADADSESGGSSSVASVATGFLSSYINQDGDISALLEILETSGEASVNAQPRISVIDGEEAVFANTTQVPFATSSIRDNNSFNQNTVTSTRVDFIDVGTILRVLPRITQDGKVIMEISSEDSSFTIRDVVSNDRVTSVPEKTQNIAETTVLVNDGETIVIGGLRTSSLSDKSNKVPILGDIPILGRLFRRTEKSHSQRELLVFITPTIIDGTTQAEAFRLAEMDQKFADTLFDDKKGDVHRSVDNFFNRDVFVSVGHKGGILADGKFVKLSELRSLIQSDESNGKTIVVRSHPRSPKGITDDIIEMAMEADRKFVVDNTLTPFVPSTSTED